MIKDNIKNAAKYFSLSDDIKKALLYLLNTDFTSMKAGRYYIDGDSMYVNVDEYETRVSDRIEAHRKYIDIQYMVKGKENMGVSAIDNLSPITEYDADKDIIFYKGKVDLHTVNQYEFIIFYPEDAHLPCQMIENSEYVKKAVVKILIK